MLNKKKILIACECSGIVANTFSSNSNFEVLSCDIQPGKFINHHIGDVLQLDIESFDLVIAFPPCTYMSSAYPKFYDDTLRLEKTLEAAQFALKIYNRSKVCCIENPRGFFSKIIPISQEIHPYYFGDAYLKRTNLYLKNLPLLIHSTTKNLFGDSTHVLPLYSKVEKYSSSNKRSEFHQGVANAMFNQWSQII
jgi:hypothetical protein